MSLVTAAHEGNLKVVKLHTANGCDFHDLNAALSMASFGGHLEVVKYLVEYGADVKAWNNRAIQNAVNGGNLDVVKYLVASGADITIDDHVLVRVAVVDENLEIVKFLVESGADFRANKNGAIKLAMFHSRIDIVRFLIESGASYHKIGLAKLLRCSVPKTRDQVLIALDMFIVNKE